MSWTPANGISNDNENEWKLKITPLRLMDVQVSKCKFSWKCVTVKMNHKGKQIASLNSYYDKFEIDSINPLVRSQVLFILNYFSHFLVTADSTPLNFM